MKKEYDAGNIRVLKGIEAVRRRPGMYIGGTDLAGFINYLISPIVLLLENQSNHISIEIEDSFIVKSNKPLRIERIEESVFPFNVIIRDYVPEYLGAILNAFSKKLEVCVKAQTQVEELLFENGELVSHEVKQPEDGEIGTIIKFNPDPEIFERVDISPAFLESYFRRLSYFYDGVQFSLTVEGETKIFMTQNGIEEFFTAISTPHQIMHDPIIIQGQMEDLQLKVVMAFQSWTEDHLYCFMNNGIAVEGGTHEDGLIQAIEQLKIDLELSDNVENGMIIVAFLRHPDVYWEGARKNKIENPEFKQLVFELVLEETKKWLQEHPQTLKQIRELQTFRFPEVWFR